MAEARALKQREYNTNITSHHHPPVDNDVKVRNHNTHKSSVFHIDPDVEAMKALENKRNAHFKDVPLKKQATRASY